MLPLSSRPHGVQTRVHTYRSLQKKKGGVHGSRGDFARKSHYKLNAAFCSLTMGSLAFTEDLDASYCGHVFKAR